MIVAIEAVGAKRGGAARVAIETTLALAEHDGIDEVVVFASPSGVRDFEFPNHEAVRVAEQPQAEPLSERFQWLSNGLSLAANAAGADVVLALNAMGTVKGIPVVSYYQQPLLYDEAARRQLDGGMRMKLTAIRSLTWRAAKSAVTHVTQTEWMRAKVSDAWALIPSKVVVATPPPPDWEPSDGVTGEDLLWVGNRLGYKRWPVAQWIHQRWREISPDSRLMATLENVSGEGIEGLGMVEWPELESRYREAGALLVTSQCESLGLPLLEALAVGCPIVAPDLPWVRTLCDNAALYWEPNRPIEAIERLRDLRDGTVRESLKDRMEKRRKVLHDADGWRRLAEAVVRSS